MIVQGAVSPDHVHMLVSFAAASCGKAGAVSEGSIEPYAAGRISAVEEAFLGATPLGSGVLLRERGRGGRGYGAAIHREPAMGRPGRELQDHRAHRASSRLSAGNPSGGFSRKPATFSRNSTHRLSAGGRLVPGWVRRWRCSSLREGQDRQTSVRSDLAFFALSSYPFASFQVRATGAVALMIVGFGFLRVPCPPAGVTSRFPQLPRSSYSVA